MSDDRHKALNRASRDAWDANAAFWDDRMGEGNDFHLQLVWPATERFLELRQGMHVLDVACGNGLTSRRLAAIGVRVLGVDVSREMIDRARAHRTEHDARIEYRVADCTDEQALLGLGEGRFDAGVCNMAIHDLAEIRPLFLAMSRVLRPGAPFVFSVLHPAFNSSNALMTAEVEEIGTDVITTYSMKVRQYLEPTVTSGIALLGQPSAQPYFNRPLRVLLGSAFDAGFVVDALEETAFPPGAGDGGFGWKSYPHIPPVLIVRLRTIAQTRA